MVLYLVGWMLLQSGTVEDQPAVMVMVPHWIQYETSQKNCGKMGVADRYVSGGVV